MRAALALPLPADPITRTLPTKTTATPVNPPFLSSPPAPKCRPPSNRHFFPPFFSPLVRFLLI